jgi:hypothetical protein
MSILCGLLLFAAGCTDQNQPVNPGLDPLDGNVPKPEWVESGVNDPSLSMTAVIRVSELSGQTIAQKFVGEEDLLAAFVGDECRSIAMYKDSLFYLYIAGPAKTVSIKYYSAHYKNLFVAPDIPFANDGILGSVAHPYSPKFAKAK